MISYGPFDSDEGMQFVEMIYFRVRKGLESGLHTRGGRGLSYTYQNKASIGVRRAAAQMMIALFKCGVPVDEDDIATAIDRLEEILELPKGRYARGTGTHRNRGYDPRKLTAAINAQIKELEKILRKMIRQDPTIKPRALPRRR